ncbi:hypothetical protein FA10DRAFT_265800 [Acaromyces ingoldii]|uniref:Uncharacterized protein n=1 Tax=Acaromyces ingoldii TaxID=215250 RepID=A0A316YRI1_9BASI|nr:hypothetical protein FA10DRAFT_265800 [Acaromyces ingoldii]PWN91987.1 hypothetical protein FA10DRAFT_265800 [Acaromyces ingoldii]
MEGGLVPPPNYSASTATNAAASADTAASTSSGSVSPGLDNFFDVVPQSDATSFQAGYLGLDGFQSWIKGDVLVKLDERARNATSGAGYDKCTISLQAIEMGPTDSITLFSSSQTLWHSASAATTSTAQPNSSSTALPSTMPFSFQLTPDLPHCIHLGTSSLQYRLEAVLHSSDPSLLSVTRSVTVHLTRYSAPGPLGADEHAGVGEGDLEPHTWHVYTPTPMVLQLKRALFRRAEPIDVRVKILPPDRSLIREKGLHLRSVEARLIRVITRRDEQTGSGGASASGGKGRSSSVDARARGDDDDGAAPHGGRGTSHESLLATSGKLCRFNTSRAIILRLTLHPPFDLSNMPHPHPDHDANLSGPVHGRGGGGGCESISQETLLHQVKFFVEVRVGIRGGQGEDRSVVVKKEVKILPGAAGGGQEVTEFSEKAGAAVSAGVAGHGDPIAGPSGGSRANTEAEDPFAGFDSEEEYDGYEDVGRSLEDGGDDLDVMDEATYRRLHDSGASSSRAEQGEDTLEDHQRRLEQLRALLDGPPPSLLESRNDVQVEVDVEGVGSAMPRALGNRAHVPNFSSHPYDSDLRGYSAREETDANGESPPSPGGSWHNDDNEPPPPPISPFPDGNDEERARSGSEGVHSDRGASYAVERTTSLPGAFVRDDEEHSARDEQASAAFPPPYVAGTMTRNASATTSAPLLETTSPALAFDLTSTAALRTPNDATQPTPTVALRTLESDTHPPAYPYTPPSDFTYQQEHHELHPPQHQNQHHPRQHHRLHNAPGPMGALGPPSYEA